MMIDWKQIDTVLLDMDGTLLDLNFDNHFWNEFVPLKFAHLRNINVDSAKKILEPQFKSMEGKLEWYCLDYWSEILQLDIVALKTELAGLIEVLPHVTEFLEKLQVSSKKVLLVTNAHPDSLALKMEKTCLQPFFDSIISSHHYGYPKENTQFWKHFYQHQTFNKKKSLMIDDSLAVLNAAKLFGIEYLISVSKPDSLLPKKVINEYVSIEDFRELMIGL